MRLLFSTLGYKPAWRVGGPVHSVSAVAERLARRGHEVTVVTANWDLTEALGMPTDRPVEMDGVQVRFFEPQKLLGSPLRPGQRDVFLYSPPLGRFVREHIAEFDIVHTHLPFSYPTLAVGNAAIRAGVPLCYHQRGVFDPARLSHKALKKRLWLNALELPLCRQAACLFSLTDAEVDSYRMLGLEGRIELVPNGVELAAGKAVMPDWLRAIGVDAEILLFMGRIHPLKGVEPLLQAFVKLASDRPKAHLVIAGPDEVGLATTLKAIAEANGLKDRVHFPGLISGETKQGLLARADLFLLPSAAEGFSMAILEALAASTPVVISPECHFSDVASAKAGLIVSATADALAAAATSILQDPAKAREMGEAGRRLVEQSYGWDSVTARFEAIYLDILKKGGASLMCGIAGLIDERGRVDLADLKRMGDAIRHRGPDGEGYWLSDDSVVGFAHKRLAIVDLSPGGAQPMHGPAGTVITFNGEIYNYRELRRELEVLGYSFNTRSDTEVLLAAWAQWGEEALQRFVGMFAFVLWDPARRQITAARDRMGEKPFFYRHDGQRLAFASELKALLSLPGAPRRLSREGLNQYLAYGYVPGGICILEGYAKLPAAHLMRFWPATGAVELERYWSIPENRPRAFTLDEAKTELASLIEASVAGQIEADVPVGILLSGGLDSSLIAAAAVRVSGRKVRTFTIGFPDSPSHDESGYANAVARHLGTDHNVLPAAAESQEDLPALVAQYCEPIADSSLLPTWLVSRLVRQQCTVALGGDGGDELFGGYLHYAWIDRINHLRAFVPQIGEGLVAAALPLGTPGRGAALSLLARETPDITLNRLLDPGVRQVLAKPGMLGELRAPEFYRRHLVAGRPDTLDRTMALDAQVYMCDDILVKVDRASMLASLEVRAPLLDHRIVEFAFRDLPASFRLQGDARKRILRELANDWLQPGFDAVRKQGFSIPIGKWLSGPWAPLVSELEAQGSPLYDPVAIKQFLARARGNDRAANRIFQLLVLEAWRHHYKIEPPQE